MNIKKRIVITSVFIIAIVLCFLIFRKFLNLQLIEENKHNILLYVKQNYILSAFAFITLHAFTTVLISFFSFPLTILGGFLFGPLPGSIFSVLGSTLGAVIVFFMFRHLWQDYIHKTFEKQLINFNKHFNKHGAWYLLVLRLIVATPFLLVSILASVSKISLFTFAWTTALGILPATFIYSYAGSKLTKLTDFNGYLPIILFITLSLVLIICIYHFFKARFKK